MGQPINPPDGWNPTAGVWGTDFQRDTTTFLTSGSSLKVVGTAGGTQTLIGRWFPIDANGAAYVATGVLQATNNTSPLTLQLDIYAGDLTTVTATVYLYNNQASPIANAWVTPSKEFTTGAGYAWARWKLTRASGSTSSVYLDRLEVKKLGPRWSCFKSNSGGNQAMPNSSTYQMITFDTTDYASLVAPSTGTVTIYRAGLYYLYLRANISLTTGTAVNVNFQANDPVSGLISLGTQQYYSPSGAFFISYSAIYRHTGTLGAGTTVGAYVLTGGCTVNAAPTGASGNGNTYVTGWTGVWLGLG